ncbi:g_PROTEIN_RECEP_F1_2 domain-containing protein [Caerostris extrusa]|uniref:G_PROTEIN_RECEP_F1_2 domain-containing protein n=1 Tax=Caerostris extrusa TaxID=172846 RepID=A0AAV4NTZ8_CAEEX|nr:g_PROTEIN_RECEP_F1_2 domain-containing protein [Caerostris extrusa]
MRSRPPTLRPMDRGLRPANFQIQTSNYTDLIDCLPATTHTSRSLCDSLNDTGESFQNESLASTSPQDEIDLVELYRVVVPVMLIVCILSLVFNLIILLSVRWVRKSLSPTLLLSLSLAVADAYASLVIGVGISS